MLQDSSKAKGLGDTLSWILLKFILIFRFPSDVRNSDGGQAIGWK